MTRVLFRAKGWLEIDGRVIAGAGKISLLEAVAEEGSLSRAAGRMGMSYRHAWGLLKEMERAAGGPLANSRRGGAEGGRTSLTPLAHELISRYKDGEKKLEKMLK